MTHEIIKTTDYLLVVDDSEIKEGDWFYLDDAVIIAKYVYTLVKPDKIAKKIIAHLPLHNAPILEGVDVLPPLEDDVEKLAESQYGTDIDSIRGSNPYDLNSDLKRGFIRGYNKAREKYKYTEEDIDKAYWAGMKFVGEDKGSYGEFIKSLSQPKMVIAFECETEITHIGNGTYSMDDMDLPLTNLNPIKVIKTITNSQGQTQWVGKYIYD